MYTEVFFDIETEKLFDQLKDRTKMADLGVSVVSAYKRKIDMNNREVEGEMRTFWNPVMKERGPVLAEFWDWVIDADRVIGFNSFRFDAPILTPHLPGDFMRMNHFDILDKVKEVLGHRLSLDAIVKETLGKKKLADGLAAVDWWQYGDEESLKKLKDYCEMDVEVTKQIYDFGLRGKKLKYRSRWNEPMEFEVDFSYPIREESPQLGLF